MTSTHKGRSTSVVGNTKLKAFAEAKANSGEFARRSVNRPPLASERPVSKDFPSYRILSEGDLGSVVGPIS